MAKTSTGVNGPFPVSKSEDDYRAEDDHRTLVRADEVRGDAKRFTAARRHAARQLRTAKRIYTRTTARPSSR